jgi:hypothetical protein
VFQSAEDKLSVSSVAASVSGRFHLCTVLISKLELIVGFQLGTL